MKVIIPSGGHSILDWDEARGESVELEGRAEGFLGWTRKKMNEDFHWLNLDSFRSF
jgi:hypothetical protein